MDPNCGVVSSPYDLRITKTADKATATEGDTVTYTLNVYNSGRSDKFIYLDDNITNGMIFDSIVVDPLRFMKWRDITNLKNDMLTNITWPDNYLYRDITSYSISIAQFEVFSNSFYNFDKDIYHIVNANPA